MNAKQKKWLAIGVALMLFAAIKFALIGWYFVGRQQAEAAPGPQALACASPRAGCELPGGGRLRFVDAPRMEAPFIVELSGIAADAAPSAEFNMRDMDMGFNRYRFVREGDSWRARVTLPGCVSGSRAWLMLLNVGGRQYQVAFDAE